MQGNQISSIFLHVGNLVNVCILCTANLSLLEFTFVNRSHTRIGNRLKRRFYTGSLNYTQATGRLGVVVDQTFLAVSPADTQKLVPGIFADEISAVSRLAKMQEGLQIVDRNTQSGKVFA